MFRKPTNSRGYTFVSDTDPTSGDSTNLTLGDSWYDSHQKETNIWNGIEWLKLAPSRSYGYLGGGGYNAVYGPQQYVERLSFPFTDARAIRVGEMYDGTSMYGARGCNSTNAGYMIGGTGGTSQGFNKILFPFDDGTTTPWQGGGSGYTALRQHYMVNSSAAGWAIGGGTLPWDDLKKITYANDSSSNEGFYHTLSQLSTDDPQAFNSSTSGYGLGGDHHNTGYLTQLRKMIFAGWGGASIMSIQNASFLTGGVTYGGCGFNSSTHGYYVHCYGGAGSDVQSCDFSNDTAAAVVSFLTTAAAHTLPGGMNSSNNGYKVGGHFGAAVYSYIERYQFPGAGAGGIVDGELAQPSFANGAAIDTTDFVNMFV